MTKNVNIVLLILAFAVVSCKKSSSTSQNQQVSNNCVYSAAANTQVNFTILSGSGQFSPLSTFPSSIYVNGQGIRGIVIYRMNQSQFLAFERSCTYDACNNNNCIVKTYLSNTALRDSICGSVYNINDGTVQHGPAAVQLYQYHTSWDGTQLQVTN